MAESVDALVSNTSGATHPGSIPGLGTRKKAKYLIVQYLAFSFALNFPHIFPTRAKNIAVSHYFFWLNVVNKLPLKRNKAY